jgi:hypothetical protein
MYNHSFGLSPLISSKFALLPKALIAAVPVEKSRFGRF